MSRVDPTELQEGAFVRLFNTAVRDLRLYLKRTLRRDEDADEIAQEAMLRIWSARDSVGIDGARPLLFRIASNLAIDRLRERRRWRFTDIAETPEPAQTVSAERSLAARQELEIVAAAITALPGNCRTAFVMSRIDGRKHAEIAAEMGISKSMVEKHVAEAVFRLSLARQRHESR
ncbi:MAG TPA: sigma-70 family RNA polymerase sigma factor [Alphaproteobacteria bacterium]|jgi:RNA polymerase sigma-70 factor (ECF subfamily)|nr:sigma-70 family RNA polymerase sigma factor [Alphaproteobacteria bacterium]